MKRLCLQCCDGLLLRTERSVTSSAAQPDFAASSSAGLMASEDNVSSSRSRDGQPWFSTHSSINSSAKRVHSRTSEADGCLHYASGQSKPVAEAELTTQAASTDSNTVQSVAIHSAHTDSSRAEPPAARQTAFTSHALHEHKASDAGPQAQSPRTRGSRMTAFSPNTEGVKGSADFVLTASDKDGKQQVVEKVYLATPQVLAGLAASALSPADAGHHAAEPGTQHTSAENPAAAQAFLNVAATQGPTLGTPLALQGAAGPHKTQGTPQQSAPFSGPTAVPSPVTANDITPNAMSPMTGAGATLGNSALGKAGQQQPVSSFQTLPFTSGHSNMLAVPPGNIHFGVIMPSSKLVVVKSKCYRDNREAHLLQAIEIRSHMCHYSSDPAVWLCHTDA